MPFTAKQLVQERQVLVTVQPEDPLKRALDLMSENDFSQLPVVRSGSILQGMITSNGVVRAVSHFGLRLDQMKVSHASEKAISYRQDDEISEILKGLKEQNAVAIVNKNNELKGIVTSYDTTEYFRRRAEDIMIAEDIETTLRDFIKDAHCRIDGDLDQDKLSRSIEAITPSGKDLQVKFRSAVCKYVNSLKNDNISPNIQLIDQIYQENFYQLIRIKSFEELTLSEYISLFKNVWEKYQSAFHELEWEAVEKLLNEIRESRNALAHFREITPQQRKQLKFCTDFLDRHRSSPDDIKIQKTSVISLPETKYFNHEETENIAISNINPNEEELDLNDSRYEPLSRWLEGQTESKISLSFSEIETLIEDSLPSSARQHRNWWRNDFVENINIPLWIGAGWLVSSVNMRSEKVEFHSIGKRQSAYIKFFNNLQEKLKLIPNILIQNTSSSKGRNWFAFEVANAEKTFCLVFSFARHSRFRLEHYIDTGDKGKNKDLFDSIYCSRSKIESDFGQSMEWERLDSKRSARIAFYRENSSINDSSEQLEETQRWAIKYLPLFFKAISLAL
jgi:CBS domain-containing protein